VGVCEDQLSNRSRFGGVRLSRNTRQLAGCLLLALFSPNVLFAQSATGIVLGTVTDETGQVLVGASVTAVSESTGAERRTRTDSTGRYELPLLPPGDYRVEVEFSGFKKLVREGVRLQVDQDALVNLTLAIGAFTEQVVVVANASLLNTRSAGLGTVVDNVKVVELPLNGRDFFQLTTLVPGVVPQVEGSQNAAAGGAVSINGAREQSNNFLLDGVDNNDLAINQIVVAPAIDTVEEFKVQTSTYAAEYGRSGGGQFAFVTKSGSNDWRFSGYEFHRSAALDARNAFDDPAQPIPEFRRNQFGATAGGPLQRQRWFAFASYEGQRLHKAITRIASVPPEAWRDGDFSSLLTGTIDPRTGLDRGQLFDPRTGLPVPGNRLAPQAMSRAGAALARFYPAPDDPRAAGPTLATVAPVARADADQITVKIDRVSSRRQWFARYSFSADERFNPFDPFIDPTNVPGFGSSNPNRGQQLATGLTLVLGDRAVADVRFGFNRFRAAIFQEHRGDDVTRALGIQGVAAQPGQSGRPGIFLGRFDPLTEPYNTPQDRRATTLQGSGSLSWARDRHSFKAGLDLRRVALDFYLDLFARGSFTFVGLSGEPFADLLMGVPFVSVRQNPQANSTTALRTAAVNAYVQDDWKISPDLTVNLGVRYEFNQPPYDTENRFSVPDLVEGVFNPVGTGGVPRAGFGTDRNDFAPRLGVAWQLPGSSSTVVRGGYGLFYDVGILNLNTLPRFNPPHFSFDAVLGPRPLEDAFGVGAVTFNQINTIDPQLRDAYYHQFSAGVQHELGPDLVAEATYVGSRGRSLPVFVDLNQGPAGGPPYRNPGFGSIISATSAGRSSYDALQLRVERRFVRGFSLLGAYTWSSSMDLGSALFGVKAASVVPQQSSNLEGEWGPSDFDTPHRLVVSTIWELPFGPGRRFVNGEGLLPVLLADWELTAIATFQAGRPFTVYYGPSANFSGTSNGSNGGPGRDRPNQVGDPQPVAPSRTQWFDPSAFAPAISAFGNVGRNSLRGDTLENVDLGAYRRLRFGRVSMQLRLEAFNVLNSVHYFLPVSDLTSASAGKVVRAADSRQIQLGLKVHF
jgi:hypothetical protein